MKLGEGPRDPARYDRGHLQFWMMMRHCFQSTTEALEAASGELQNETWPNRLPALTAMHGRMPRR